MPLPFIAFMFLADSGFGKTVITDPQQDFFSRIELVPDDTCAKLEADFNNDGQLDVAYTAASLKNDAEVGELFSWDVYMRVPGGFRRIGWKDSEGYVSMDTMLDFRKDRYWIGMIPEVNAYGLLTMTEGGIKSKGELKGRLKALIFDADGVRTVNVGPETNDIDSLNRCFPKILAPAIQSVLP